MMKTTQVKNAPSNGAGTKSLHCWSKAVQTELLRLELADGSFFLFPYTQIMSARFEPRDSGDRLTLHLPNYDVQITGTNLRELGLAFQKVSVEWVRVIPERYHPLADEEGVRVEQIEVKEIQHQQ
jgi:beta-glucosidase/6-phospho-beta-glucosidase/beta-galactosidase